jgi:hypothetical protein
MDWIKENAKCVGGVLGALLIVFSVFGGVLTFDGRYEKVGAAKAEAQAVEQKVVKNLDEFQKNQKVINQEQRYQVLTDQMMTQKQLIKKYPNDPELKEDYVIIKEERDKVKEELNKTR